MIVVIHSVAIFNMDPSGQISKLPLSQGVSFFFVLSGFILTYVYGELKGWKATLKFLSARIARVWPVFFVTEVVAYLIVSNCIIAKSPLGIATTVVSHFCMLHGWIPISMHYFALNAPSWSISTEFFFYLAFPLLLLNLRRQWLTKVLLVAMLPLSLILICNLCGVAEHPAQGKVSSHGLMYINPLSRLFEFYCGMLVCLIVTKFGAANVNLQLPVQRTKLLFTFCEILAFVWIAVVIANTNQWLSLAKIDPHSALGQYLLYSGNLLGYGALITAVAIRRGYASKALSIPFFVFLGEVSYSVYLWHYPLILLYLKHSALLLTMPRTLRYGLFWTILIAISSITFLWVEKPCRRILRQLLERQVERALPG